MGTPPIKKKVFFQALPKLPPLPLPPIRYNDDYDNDGSDNCDHNFGTFDDFGVKS